MDNFSPFLTERLSKRLLPHRFDHSVGVSQTAVKLAGLYGGDVSKARVAGLLHDCARDLSSHILLKMAESFGIVVSDVEAECPMLLHAPVGACLAKADFGITDEEILAAIRCHTTGCRDMSLLAKIIFLADYIEPQRDFPGVDILRELAWRDLDKAVLAGYDQTLLYIIRQGGLIHGASVEGRNALITSMQ